MEYETLFERNLGVLDAAQQERLQKGRVVIAGCGGIGGTIAIILARSGVGNFVLMDPQDYEPTNMNRQIACFTDTCGKNKAVSIADDIRRINPEANIVVHPRGIQIDDVPDLVNVADVFLPVMDSWPLSLTILEAARKKVPTIMSYPVGALGRTCVFTARSPSVAECLAMPYGYGYEALRDYTATPAARRLLTYYMTEGAWSAEWFGAWVDGQRPHAQLSTIVWATAALSSLEVLKLLTGKWLPVVAPRYWKITPTGAAISRFGIGRRIVSRASRWPWVQRGYPLLTGSPRLLRLFTRLLS